MQMSWMRAIPYQSWKQLRIIPRERAGRSITGGALRRTSSSEARHTPSLSFMVGGEYQHWSHIADGYSNLVQLHLGTEFAVSDQIRLAAGFFTQDAPEDIPGNPLVENFLSFGFRWHVSPAVDLSASVL